MKNKTITALAAALIVGLVATTSHAGGL